jgi:hypothetical protein
MLLENKNAINEVLSEGGPIPRALASSPRACETP